MGNLCFFHCTCSFPGGDFHVLTYFARSPAGGERGRQQDAVCGCAVLTDALVEFSAALDKSVG